MIDASLAFFWCDGGLKHTFLGEDAPPGVPLYEMYRLWQTADGHLMYFTATDSEWEGLFRALGHPEWLDDERFNTTEARTQNSEVLGELLMTEILQHKTTELIERMDAEDVPVGPVLTIDELFDDPQLRHNEAILEFDPESVIDRIHPRPLLMIAAERDQIVPNEETVGGFEAAREPKQLVWLPRRFGHWGADVGEGLELALDATRTWLAEWMPAHRSTSSERS